METFLRLVFEDIFMGLTDIIGTIDTFLRGDDDMVVMNVENISKDIHGNTDVYNIKLRYEHLGLTWNVTRRYQGDSPPKVGKKYLRD